MNSPICRPLTVPVDDQGRWIDSRYWRDHASVTHWHLVGPREWAMDDKARFDDDRMRAERVRSSAGVAGSPHEVVSWLESTLDGLIEHYQLTDAQLRSSGIATPEDRRMGEEVRFFMAMYGRDVCSMLAVGATRIVHYNAYAMTAKDCTAPH